MTASDAPRALAPPAPSTALSIATLVVLSPVMTEVLMGVVHVTNLWLLIPQIGVYGVAALIIRDAARRRGRGWPTVLLLGVAYAVAEECLILQTSFTPQFFPAATTSLGWAFGVQWIYLIAMLWYESVYAIVLPIYLTELLFPAQRTRAWLNSRTTRVAWAVFVVSSVGVWWLWSHVGVHKYGESAYRVPRVNLAAALAAILVIVAVALAPGRRTRRTGRIPRVRLAPLAIGLMSFGHSLAWWVFIALAYVPAAQVRGASPVGPIVGAIGWLALALLVVRFQSPGWQDSHRLALVFGAIVASMIGGVMTIVAASRVDQIGKLVLDLAAIGWFVYLARSVRRRANPVVLSGE